MVQIGRAESPSSRDQAQMDREVAEMEHSRITSNSTASSSSDLEVGAPRVGPSDFELLKVVGQGAFGKVRSCLLVYTTSGAMYFLS